MKKGPNKKKRLTPQQGKLVNAVVADPSSTLDELGVKSGYTSAQHVHRALQAPAVQDALAEVKGLMSKRKRLSLDAILDKLEEGLDATEIRSLKVDGEKLTVSAEVKDFAVRRNYMRDALELHGVIGNKEGLAPSGPVNVAIILAGGGSDAEKTALADALLAARLSRGLHPLENRALTADEAEQFRRTP